MKKLIRRAKEIFEKYERYFSPAAFLAGFTWDNMTLKRIDLLYENIILASYLALILACIVFVNFRESRRPKFAASEKGALLIPYAMQFAFGGIFSGFFVFYSHSASLSTSWPFLAFLLAILVGNEFFRSRYSKFTFQISLFYIALFSYSIFIVPIITGKIGADIFIVSSLVSLTVLSIILLIMKSLTPVYARQNWTALLIVIPAIYITFSLLYFTNIIPPIPLSLKEIGLYHSVIKTADGNYEVEYEPQPFAAFFDFPPNKINRYGDKPIYVFASIFAPTKINAEIFHRWEYFDEITDKWITVSRLAYNIAGGRDGGYRGWTRKQNASPGKWRVSVETERGQIIGRIKFTVINAASPPKTLTKLE